MKERKIVFYHREKNDQVRGEVIDQILTSKGTLDSIYLFGIKIGKIEKAIVETAYIVREEGVAELLVIDAEDIKELL